MTLLEGSSSQFIDINTIGAQMHQYGVAKIIEKLIFIQKKITGIGNGSALRPINDLSSEYEIEQTLGAHL